ncbi:MAG: 30S ribosomal protein S12 methylthiotransferase RimO [Ruminococcus sp.]|nr:30S ribosomal protein S12 methylthiotransferase RimO [Ruminococcus sp.]
MAVRVGMVSLGCAKNQVDAERMLFILREAGFEIVADAALSDVVIVNTCGFIESAKQEAIDTILEFCTLKQEGRIKAVICTGCLSERYRDEVIKEIPELDAVVGIGCNSEIADIVRNVLSGAGAFGRFSEKEALDIEGGRIISTQPFYAYLKIAEGCDNCCTYCAIPSIRGRFRSRAMEDIISEAKWLAESGVTELVVIAQDTTRYGEDNYGEQKLPELLRELCKIEGIKWIRTLYCYPERITDELLDTIASEEKLVKYLDIPMQHCNGDILKRMNRRGDRESLSALIAKIRARIPGVILRTTMLVGFPGETEEQFTELCQFIKDMKFERLGCFAYSAEEGTPAASFEDQVPIKIKEKRSEIVMEEQMFISDRFNESMIGRTLEVVTEGFDRYAECWYGRSAMDAPEIDGKVFFASDRKLREGEYVSVTIDDVMDYDLIGTRV